MSFASASASSLAGLSLRDSANTTKSANIAKNKMTSSGLDRLPLGLLHANANTRQKNTASSKSKLAPKKTTKKSSFTVYQEPNLAAKGAKKTATSVATATTTLATRSVAVQTVGQDEGAVTADSLTKMDYKLLYEQSLSAHKVAKEENERLWDDLREISSTNETMKEVLTDLDKEKEELRQECHSLRELVREAKEVTSVLLPLLKENEEEETTEETE